MTKAKEGKYKISEMFKIDFEKIREGYYSDDYFTGVRTILERLSGEGYKFAGANPDGAIKSDHIVSMDIGNLETDMQIFTRREPFSIVAGTDYVKEIVKECTGSFDDASGKVKKSDVQIKALSVGEGEKAAPWQPVMRLTGRYREYAILETVILGILSRASLIATNTYNFLEASNGKPILFFPARFDFYLNQELDGYAYKVGIDAYQRDYGVKVEPLISTMAQGAWWGGARWGGAMSHSYLVCFIKDTEEAALQFARCAPPEYKRIVLVDVNNNSIKDGLSAAKALFKQYLCHHEKGEHEEAMKYKLYGVRLDTPRNLRDVAIPPLGDPELDCGVNPRLVFMIREAFDRAPEEMNLPLRSLNVARKYFSEIKIVASGGFNVDRIKMFEKLAVPADIYSVGSSFLSEGQNNYTADLVRVKFAGKWASLAKAGRKAMLSDRLFREE